jgi:alpha-galactosidase
VAEDGPEVTIERPGRPGQGNKHMANQVWARELAGGSRAVGLFNLGDEPATVTARWSDIGLAGRQVVRDLWRQKDVGTFEDAFGSKVPPHGVVLVKISPAM